MKKRKKINKHSPVNLLLLTLSSMSIIVAIIAVFIAVNWSSPAKCANSASCVKNISGLMENDVQGVFEGKKVYARDFISSENITTSPNSRVLGEQTGDFKRIYVDLTNQRLYAFEGNNIFMNVPVSTGKWYPTPTGNFRIWIWLRYTRMSGGSGAGYYNLPNVPYTMYFYNDAIPKSRGFGLHGAYWHNNFGHPMSHGCINMKIEDVEKLFYWSNSNAKSVTYPTTDNPGTLLTIYGNTPKE